MFDEVVQRAEAAGDAGLSARLRELESDRRRTEAEMAVVLQQLEDRKVFRVDEHASMWGLLRTELHGSDGDCRTGMRVARLIDRFPDVGERLYDGHMSVAGVAEIARVAAHPRIGDQIETLIGHFTSQAERAEYDVVRRKIRSWERRTDAKGAGNAPSPPTRHVTRTGPPVQWHRITLLSVVVVRRVPGPRTGHARPSSRRSHPASDRSTLTASSARSAGTRRWSWW